MEDQNPSFVLTAESGSSERGGQERLHRWHLNDATVQTIVNDAFDQVMTSNPDYHIEVIVFISSIWLLAL